MENTSVPLKVGRIFGGLLVLAVPVYFAFLSLNSVWDTNEAFYVETPVMTDPGPASFNRESAPRSGVSMTGSRTEVTIGAVVVVAMVETTAKRQSQKLVQTTY